VGSIDDCQASHAEADLRGDEFAGVVRAAVDEGIGHATDKKPDSVSGYCRRGQEACYAAHIWLLIVMSPRTVSPASAEIASRGPNHRNPTINTAPAAGVSTGKYLPERPCP
jgi:hypothetical protein